MKLKDRKRASKELFALPPGKLEPVDLTGLEFIRPRGMTRAFRNNRYTVMVYDDTPTTHGPATKVLIQKHDGLPITNHWREMQAIKNEVFGPEVTAIEYYPPESELIDEYNIYWLWVFPAGVLPAML